MAEITKVVSGDGPVRFTAGDDTGPEPWQYWSIVAPLPDGAGAVGVSIDQTDLLLAQRSGGLRLHDSDERFRLLAEHAPIGIFISDAEGQLLYANPAALELVGVDFDELRKQDWYERVHPDDHELLEQRRAAARGSGQFLAEYRLLRNDGSVRWVRARAAWVNDDLGHPIAVVGTAADITDLVAADARIREREERLRAILETAAEGIISSDENGLIIEFNAAAERIFGYDSDEVVGKESFGKLIAPPMRDVLVGWLNEHLAGGPPKVVGRGWREAPGLRKDGEVVPLELAVTEVQTSEGRLFTAVVHDISERKRFEQELEHLATHDPVTGLPNRALLTAQLEAALARANRHGSSVGVLFVDIDRIKLVTESLGHRAADELITSVAQRIGEAAGSSATVTRFSSDQFVVFVEDLEDVGDAVEIAVRIIESVNEPFQILGDEAFVDASVGVAFAPEGMGTAETLVSNADVAMSRAKDSSLTRYEVFDAEMRAWVDNRRRTEIALRRGIERGEFELHYQPVVALDSGEIYGVEALIRWQHPHFGLLPPSEFIPIAEDSSLIVPLGEWIIEEACRQLADWQERHSSRNLRVSVNLSGRQLALPSLPETIAAALAQTSADPACLSFEITETVLLHDVETARKTLDGLKEIGVRLALDDFGTGYSPLTYLCDLPIDVVKIDRSFVSQLGQGTRDLSIVEAVISLARTLDLDVVAEGVETEDQAEMLRTLGCTYGQGYLFSRPIPTAELEDMIAAGRTAV
jgi:PAS domain S-box-containing protein/diguanylate cyclase (GGDEF)-like protein